MDISFIAAGEIPGRVVGARTAALPWHMEGNINADAQGVGYVPRVTDKKGYLHGTRQLMWHRHHRLTSHDSVLSILSRFGLVPEPVPVRKGGIGCGGQHDLGVGDAAAPTVVVDKACAFIHERRGTCKGTSTIGGCRYGRPAVAASDHLHMPMEDRHRAIAAFGTCPDARIPGGNA